MHLTLRGSNQDGLDILLRRDLIRQQDWPPFNQKKKKKQPLDDQTNKLRPPINQTKSHRIAQCFKLHFRGDQGLPAARINRDAKILNGSFKRPRPPPSPHARFSPRALDVGPGCRGVCLAPA
jgi:hypothetical protein